jgi:hypothetical protein
LESLTVLPGFASAFVFVFIFVLLNIWAVQRWGNFFILQKTHDKSKSALHYRKDSDVTARAGGRSVSATASSFAVTAPLNWRIPVGDTYQ